MIAFHSERFGRRGTGRIAALAVLSGALFMGCGRRDAEGNKGAAGEARTLQRVRVTGIPDENPTELARQYQPLVALLEKNLGVAVEYVPVTDYGAAVQALAAGKVDFAWLGGFTYVQARDMAKVEPLVMRDVDREFHSVFIANTASGIKSVQDSKGKKFVFGSKSSTSGHLMPRHFLMKNFKIDPDKDFDGPPVFSGAHDATVKMVESGKVGAGALNMQVWKRLVAEGNVDPTKVVAIWQTPPYVDYVWTARSALPASIREKFAKSFLKLDAANPDHNVILERLGAKKYVPAKASDFDAIESVARESGLLK